MSQHTERTKQLMAADRRHVWHPFTQMQAWEEEDFPVIEAAEGCWLVDTDGQRYLDGISALWCNVHGHRVPQIDHAVIEQLGRVAHSTLLGMASAPSIELAERLAALAARELSPELSRVFYSDAGATAVEVALKMAFQYQRQRGNPERTRFAALGSAYHGDTIGSVSIGGIEVMHGVFDPLRFEVLRLPSPHCYRCPLELSRSDCALACADRAAAILTEHAASLAGVVVEPLVQGAAGIIVHPQGYLARIAETCRELDLLLVADEVATGFGRTGTFFACSQEGVTPDLLCLAKGLSGGYLPLAATLATEQVYEAFLGSLTSGRTFFHGHTFTGNPLGCAAALASLDLLEGGVMAALPDKVARLERLLAAQVEPLAHVGQVRQKGTMVGIELVADRSTHEPFPSEQRLGHQVVVEARRRGVVIRPLGDVVVLMPALAMADDELELLVRTTAEAITAITEA